MVTKANELKRSDEHRVRSDDALLGTDPIADRYSQSGSEGYEMNNDLGEHPQETEHLKAQIEETRNQMGETIDAIQEKLSFANVSEQVSEHVSNAIESAKHSIYEATIGKAVTFMKDTGNELSNTNVVRTVRNNPIPIALIGIGAGLLAYQAYSGKGRNRSGRGNGKYLTGGRYNSKIDEQPVKVDDTSPSAESGYAGAIAKKASKAYESVANTASNTVSGVNEKLNEAYSSANDLAHRAYDTAGQYGTKLHDTYDHYIEEKPLAVGAIALGLGAAIGLAIPSSRYENELMGETRQGLMDKAQTAANDLIDKAKHVADEVGKTIKEEAQALTQ
jgi:ElaB/YqjD/DUF883 family membrane-anchored ribosome-binding protein